MQAEWPPSSAVGDGPEWTRQAGLSQQLLHDGWRSRRPSEIETIRVPRSGKPPHLFDWHDGAFRHLTLRAPPIDVLFGPEEQEVRSCERDVLPEPSRRNNVMDDAAAVDRAAANGDCQLGAAVVASCVRIAVADE